MSLIEAVRAADAARVRELLCAGADANEPGPGSRTPLIEAAAIGDPELVQLLLEAGADPSLQDDERESAILKAAAHGHRAVVALLAPHATEDERDMARAFLAASADPDGLLQREPAAGAEDRPGRLLTVLGARASAFFGDDDAAKRLERIERSKKKR